ncbi:hypothetical protein FRB93_000152 [Tulasnella sp. JGI-2019a]|nr:hypothetical protein FRB93_000152 [Tulasnella sp. JGI-2019a]
MSTFLTEKGNSSGERLPSDSVSLEKGTHPAGNAYVTPADDDRYHFDAHDLDKVQRRLKQRHVQMIAIGEPQTRPTLSRSHCTVD